MGLNEIDDDFLSKVSVIIPKGDYCIKLLDISPTLITLGSLSDYFCNEQVDLWGIDPFWGVPHFPKVQYYRGLTTKFDDDKMFFEFVIPMFPHQWLDTDSLQAYETLIQAGKQPTALALSVLDIRGPAVWPRDAANNGVTQHWCLAHYLFDGHHKIHASYASGKPITLLSFLAVSESIAAEEDINFLFDHLR